MELEPHIGQLRRCRLHRFIDVLGLGVEELRVDEPEAVEGHRIGKAFVGLHHSADGGDGPVARFDAGAIREGNGCHCLAAGTH